MSTPNISHDTVNSATSEYLSEHGDISTLAPQRDGKRQSVGCDGAFLDFEGIADALALDMANLGM